MFVPPHCGLGGELLSDWATTFSAIYCDPHGALWAIDASGTRLFSFSVSAAIHTMATLPSSSSSSVPPQIAAEALPDPIFECGGTDRIHSVVFPMTRDAERLFVCIATADGCLALGDARESRSVLLHSDLGAPLTAVVAVPPTATQMVRSNGVSKTEEEEGEYAGNSAAGVLVAFFDGEFSEVAFLQWGSDHDGKTGDDGVCATGLFRIRGSLHSVMVDEVCERIVTVALSGDVDVWNWRKGLDETQSFGMPAYLVEEHGTPSCAVLLGGCQLWIGTTTGSIVVFCLQLGAGDGSPRCVWRAHKSGGPVRNLLLMSLGCHVWSCAEDRQIYVWDVKKLTLEGSFQFPGNGVVGLRCGMRYIDSTVWCVNETLGTVSWFAVREPLLLCGRSCSLIECNESVMKRSDVERLRVLEILVSHLCSLVRGTGAGSGTTTGDTDEMRRIVMSTPPHVDVALQQLEEGNDYPTARSLPLLVASLIAGQRMLQHALSCEGRRSKSFLEDLQHVLEGQRRYRGLQEQVGRCLSEIRDRLPEEEVCESLEDLTDMVLGLLQRKESPPSTSLFAASNVGKELEPSLLTQSGSMQETATPVKPSGNARDIHMEGFLEARFVEEEKRRQHAEAQLAEMHDEKQELQRQLEQSLRLQEDYERRNLSLERLLKTAKKAAAVTSSEATQLYEMEASLHNAHCTVQTLQEKVEGLVRERQDAALMAQETNSLRALVRRFETKEQLAKEAFSNFIETQNRVLDDLDTMLHDPDDMDDEKTLRTRMTTLYEWLCARAEEQHEFHTAIKRRYTTQFHGDEDHRGQS